MRLGAADDARIIRICVICGPLGHLRHQVKITNISEIKKPPAASRRQLYY